MLPQFNFAKVELFAPVKQPNAAGIGFFISFIYSLNYPVTLGSGISNIEWCPTIQQTFKGLAGHWSPPPTVPPLCVHQVTSRSGFPWWLRWSRRVPGSARPPGTTADRTRTPACRPMPGSTSKVSVILHHSSWNILLQLCHSNVLK